MRKQLQPAAQQRNQAIDLADCPTAISPEVGDRLEVGRKPSQSWRSPLLLPTRIHVVERRGPRCVDERVEAAVVCPVRERITLSGYAAAILGRI
ncbi:hypothetical protein [Cupriavidus sp. CuC1]|uniref:hypothetical protein n=1 Tax=Cupriavidus sp. CuC1 TaxID=3373131 RepID=UPI0037CFBCCA